MTECLAFLESDFSAIHRRDMWQVPGPEFFRLADLLEVYPGAMQAWRRAEREQGTGGVPAAGAPGERLVDGAAAAVDPVLSQFRG